MEYEKKEMLIYQRARRSQISFIWMMIIMCRMPEVMSGKSY